ncbi:hypothetical protein [Staphylococcus capitis]|uniref:hypothetical protein n=1 Tax=Staphylococcus capitis TaxID=29388 RepID=UPI00345BD616
MSWSSFEEEAFQYIKDNFKLNNGEIIKLGASDSTKSDICINLTNCKFNIEVKEENAQSVQFVVKVNDKLYSYSDTSKLNLKNNEHLEKLTQKIISIINDKVEKKSEFTKNELYLSNEWVKEFYKSKGVWYFISKYQNEFIIFHINNFNKYVKTKPVMRNKKSGSTALPKKIF